MYSALKSLYENVKCAVRVNGQLTEWFDVICGLKQGCIISPLLFNLFVNDFAMQINSLGKGINCGDEQLSLLMYADDMVLLCENEADLQCMLNVLYGWCQKWGMCINNEKTKIVHFRNPSNMRSNFHFICGDKDIDFTDKYKYLGLILNEYLDYHVTAKAVSQSDGRALGLLIAKSKAYGGMPYDCFTKCYDALVRSVINYGAAVWGFKEYSCINAIQNRASRFFLGLGRYAPNIAVQGEMGWTLPGHDQWIAVTRQWCRLVNMDNNRICKKVFSYCISKEEQNCKNWSFMVKRYYESLDMQYLCNVSNYLGVESSINALDRRLSEHMECIWYSKLNIDHAVRGEGGNKLRTYRKFKQEFCKEPYVTSILSKTCRSALAKFRCGIAPIRIETGRYGMNRLPVNERLCEFCDANEVEDEFHVVMKCSFYTNIRNTLFTSVLNVLTDFEMFPDTDKFNVLMSSPVCMKLVARALSDILSTRKCATVL